MEILTRTRDQFLALYRSMAPSQRLSFLAVTLMVVFGLGVLMYGAPRHQAMVPLAVGKVFTVEEVIRAEEALITANLTDFQREGQRIMVPALEVEKYNSALIATGTLPSNWAEEWEKQYADLGPFANSKQMSERKEIARAKLASQMISALPDVDSANVVWDEQAVAHWPDPKRSTATVFVRAKPGRELSTVTFDAIRHAIAGMKADLRPEEVTVFDLNRGIAHQASGENDPFNSGLVRHINNLKEMYRAEVLRAVDYIENVKVGVSVDIDRIKSAVRRKQEIQTKGSAAIVTTESKRSTTSQQTAKRTEPGQNSNGPIDLASAGGADRSETSEDSDTANLSAPSFELTEEDILGAMPQNVQVSVSIPEDYYRAVAIQSNRIKSDAPVEEWNTLLPAMRTEINNAVALQVSKVIPKGTTDDPLQMVSIGTYTRIPQSQPADVSNFMDTLMMFGTRWGSTILLGLIGLLVWRQLSQAMSQTAKATPPLPTIVLPNARAETAQVSEAEALPELPVIDTRSRDTLQHLVRDNPEMTATILSKWLAEAK